MKTLRFISVATILLFSMVSMYGQGYQQVFQAVGPGGGNLSSTSYSMTNTIGETVTGQSTSASYTVETGFSFAATALQGLTAGSYAVNGGWNMVSVPKEVSDYRKGILFPTATSAAFSYEGAYRTRDTLQNGTGYWLKFIGSESISYDGTLTTAETIAVAAKWNMIGSIGTPVATSSIIQNPSSIVTSQYYGFNGGYYSTSTIVPGRAYWVKTSAPGTLTLSTASSASPEALAEAVPSTENLNSLTLVSKGESARLGQLYFGAVKDNDPISLDRYELPPTPPKGTFDVRFGSQRTVQLFEKVQASAERDVQVLFQNAGEPLTLQWSVQEKTPAKRYVLLKKVKGKIAARQSLSGTGTITLMPDEKTTYWLRSEEIPTTYTLRQNYPNPFNPSTAFEYDLPEQSRVSLTVYSILGQEVDRVIDDELAEAGMYREEFDGSRLATGTYFYRLRAVNAATGKVFEEVRKMMLVK